MNPFSLLDLQNTASEKDIKIAFRKKAMLYHPDRGGNEENFRKIYEAYHTLMNPSTKAKWIAGPMQNEEQLRANTLTTSKTSVASDTITFTPLTLPNQKNITFNEREEKIINFVVEEDRSVFIHGPGGTGKSTLINEISKRLNGKKNIAITATTGVAAVAIGGTTLHRFAGIGLGQLDAVKLFQKVNKNKLTRARWNSTKVLVIDEVSMMGGELFEKLEFIARKVRRCEKPFGGMQLVFCGDLLQLPPIKDKWIFEANCWESLKLKTISLTESRRFTNDSFFKMLLRFRSATHTQEDFNLLKTRNEAYKELKKSKQLKTDIKPSILYSKKIDVDSFNNDELKKLSGGEFLFEAVDDFISLSTVNDQQKGYYNILLDEAIPPRIVLKVGAQVMLRKNLDLDAQLVNGSRGIVKEIKEDEGCVIVKFKNGVTCPIYQESWEFDDEEVLSIRMQIPLILAWSITIHKSQGATLDSVIVDLGDSVFSNAQAYVALSRVRKLDDLYISELSPHSIHADQEALSFSYLLKEKEKNPIVETVTRDNMFDEDE